MKKILVVLMSIFIFTDMQAQDNSIRLGLFGLAYGGINLKYERKLSENISLGATVGFVIPHRIQLIETILNNNTPIPSNFSNLHSSFTNFSVVPEMRYYSEGDGMTGFYLAPALEISNTNLDISTISNNDYYNLKLNATGIGLSANIGVQWIVGPGFTIDWTIIGFGGTAYLSTLNAVAVDEDLVITDAEKEEFERTAKAIPFIGSTITKVELDNVNNRLEIGLSPILPVIRSSFSLGWSF